MGINTTMHVKSDSDLTSVGEDQTLTLTPPRSPRHHRPLYYVQSPSNSHDKMSFGSSPFGSPGHHHYHCSPIHHSRESSTSRTFSASLKNAVVKHGGSRDVTPWKRIEDGDVEDGDDDLL
nr:putative late embryogenesis abundant protein, LEA-14 [Tanacetum cinerariifolium]